MYNVFCWFIHMYFNFTNEEMQLAFELSNTADMVSIFLQAIVL